MSYHTVNTDMLASARNAQWSADTFLGPGSTKLVAPAKVNLFLGIQNRRADGFHNVVNIMHSIALHDVLYLHTEPLPDQDSVFELTEDGSREDVAIGGPEDNLAVVVDMVSRDLIEDFSIPARSNIVFKAVDALARAVSYTNCERVAIHLEKHIPNEGGLGGGSSDAAATLLGLASRWGLRQDDDRLIDVGNSLGSDVVFFMYGGCVLLNDAGGHFIHELEPMKSSLLLVKPTGGVSTRAAYAAFDEAPIVIPPDQLQAAFSALKAADVNLYNNLAPAAEMLKPELTDIRDWLSSRVGVQNVLLCGSGATTFARTDTFAQACDLATIAQRNGLWARATTFSSLRATVMGDSA